MWHTETRPSVSEAIGSPSEVENSTTFSAEATVGIVHDLGNLIQIASSAVHILARRLPPHAGDLDPVIAGAKTSLDRAGTLVRQTIGMVRAHTAEVERVSLAACLAEIETLVRISWDHRVQLDVRAGPDLPPVKCDPLALQNAVLNLLFNARDAMPDGGVISIHADAISLGSNATALELRVVDNGIGMTPDTIVRAFEPFFTTKRDGLGGVGLPMVERFAQDAGGRVLIESEYGVGTAVILQLPASPMAVDLHLAIRR